MAFQQFVTGGVFGFSAVILPQLQRPDALVHVDADQASWIGILHCVCIIIINKIYISTYMLYGVCCVYVHML